MRGVGKTAGSKLQHSIDLLPAHVKLLHDLRHGHAVLEVLEDSYNGQARTAEDPRPAHLAWNALHGGAL